MGQQQLTATEEEVSAGNQGRCRACGAEAWGVEPDARGHECGVCGAAEVYGLDELLILGELEIEA